MAAFKNYSPHFLSCFFTLLYMTSSTDARLGIEKVSHLHFYFHNVVSGKDPTSKEIIATGNGIDFGSIFIDNDVLTEGPELTSKVIGRGQGLVAFDAPIVDPTMLVALTFAFTDGEFNGSSLSVLGRIHAPDAVRELPIVGGTGAFRFARGFGVMRNIQLDVKTADGLDEYNMTVLHY